MPAVRYQVAFEHPVPAIEDIAARFRQLTGLELVIEEFDQKAYALSAGPLNGHVELAIGPVIDLIVFRIRTGYLEWSLVWTLRDLGGRVPLPAIPKYAQSPWSSLPRYKQWLHR